MSEVGEEREPRFFFSTRHFRNQRPFSIVQFFLCVMGAFLSILVGGLLLSDPYYCDIYLDCTGKSFLGYKIHSLAKYSPASIPYFWAMWLAFFWSTVSFSFIILRNFTPQDDITINPRKDPALRKHLQFFIGFGVLSWAFLVTPIEAIEGSPADFAAISFYPLILFFGTGAAVFAAFPIAFFGMLAKVIVVRPHILE